jgi:hypothetical protein
VSGTIRSLLEQLPIPAARVGLNVSMRDTFLELESRDVVHQLSEEGSTELIAES